MINGPGSATNSCGCPTQPELVADGSGIPKSFEDLAGTCESCGDDVDPDLLIEGECPGCHYRPDAVADGGVHTVTCDGQEFAVVRQQEFVDESEIDIGPSGDIQNFDELEKHTVVRLLSLDAIRAQELWNRVIEPDDSDWREEYADLELGESIVPEQDDPVADGGGVTWSELIAFQRDVLEAIQRLDNDGQTTYGLAIKRELERVYDEEVNHGRLYPNLDDLVDADLVEKGELDKRTNSYDLTAEGKSMLEQRARLLADACGMEQPVADGGEN